MLNLTNSFNAATAADAWLPLLHLVYLLSGLLMASGYVGQIRKAWRQPQASLLALSMPSWLLWTACRMVALAYGVWVIRDAAFIAVVGLDLTGRIGVVLALLRARLLQRTVRCEAGPVQQRGGANARWFAAPALTCPLLCALMCAMWLPAFNTLAQTAPMAQGSPSQQTAYDYARQLLKDKLYAEAFGRFAELADQGHVPSARMALALYDHGTELFGQTWSATPGQQRRWYMLSQRLNNARSFVPDTEARE